MEKSDLTAASATENQTEIAVLKASISELKVLIKYYEEQFHIFIAASALKWHNVKFGYTFL